MKRYKIMSINEILDRALDIYKGNMGTFLLYLFIIYIITIPLGIISYVVTILPIVFMLNSIVNPFSLFMEMDIFPLAVIIIVGVFLIGLTIAIQMIQQSGVVFIAGRGFLNRNSAAEKVLKVAFKNTWRIITALVASGILIFIPLVALSSGIIGLLMNFNYELDSFTIVGLIVLGLLLLIGIIYFYTVHIFVLQTITLERLGFFKALKRSRELVKDSFWRILGIIIVFILIISAIANSIYGLIGILGGIIYGVMRMFDFQGDLWSVLLMYGNLLRLPIQVATALFIGPVGSILLTVLYYNQRFKKEGYDIRLELRRLKDAQQDD